MNKDNLDPKRLLFYLSRNAATRFLVFNVFCLGLTPKLSPYSSFLLSKTHNHSNPCPTSQTRSISPTILPVHPFLVQIRFQPLKCKMKFSRSETSVFLFLVIFQFFHHIFYSLQLFQQNRNIRPADINDL